jgi:hypothetical protein
MKEFTVIGKSGGDEGELILCVVNEGEYDTLQLVHPDRFKTDETGQCDKTMTRLFDTVGIETPRLHHWDFLPAGLYTHTEKEGQFEVMGIAEYEYGQGKHLYVVGFYLYHDQRLYLCHYYFPGEWDKSGWETASDLLSQS